MKPELNPNHKCKDGLERPTVKGEMYSETTNILEAGFYCRHCDEWIKPYQWKEREE